MRDCDNITVCKNIGRNLEQAFEGYHSKYLERHATYVSKGDNGKVVKLHFNKGNLRSPVLLKMGIDKVKEKPDTANMAIDKVSHTKVEKVNHADNLYYEGLVGKKLNLLADIFPCFIRTFGLVKESEQGDLVIDVKHDYETKTYKFARLTDLPSIDSACKSYGHQGVLIEYIEGHLFKSMYKEEHFQYEMIPVLFQVYYALWMLGPNYTHYDLHTANVILTKPNKNGVIAFEYILPNGEKVSFMCSYVAKIIDYGRSYLNTINLSELKTSEDCNNTKCGPLGKKCGFRNYESFKHKALAFKRSNVSHDLRLLNYAVRFLKSPSINSWKGPDVNFHPGGFSTEELKMTGLDPSKPNGWFINNVADAGYVLANMLKDTENHFKNLPVLGLIKVDGNQVDNKFKHFWKFIPTTSGPRTGGRYKSRNRNRRKIRTRRRSKYKA